jgi:hypothetical protein
VTNQTFRGVLKDQTLVILDCAAPLPDGTPMEVTLLRPEAGSAEAVLAAMAAEPHLTTEDIAELERAINQGLRPAAAIDPFAEDVKGAKPD